MALDNTDDQSSSTLPGLLAEIKYVILNNKENFKKVFNEKEASELMFKISSNFRDRDSIKKMYKLLTN